MTRWALEVQLAGEMPSLPSQNSPLRTALMQHRPYLDRVVTVSERLGYHRKILGECLLRVESCRTLICRKQATGIDPLRDCRPWLGMPVSNAPLNLFDRVQRMWTQSLVVAKSA